LVFLSAKHTRIPTDVLSGGCLPWRSSLLFLFRSAAALRRRLRSCLLLLLLLGPIALGRLLTIVVLAFALHGRELL